LNIDLSRFHDAQADVIDRVTKELSAGAKVTHWMWFIFPQVADLGVSATAERYAIRSAEEAHAYLADPILGERLRRCSRLLLAIEGRSARQILGEPDDLKLRSSMTLFGTVGAPDDPFGAVLDKYFDGLPDPRTVEILRRWVAEGTE
jgi:uncharacterized protein (DUF1810 family)